MKNIPFLLICISYFKEYMHLEITLRIHTR